MLCTTDSPAWDLICTMQASIIAAIGLSISPAALLSLLMSDGGPKTNSVVNRRCRSDVAAKSASDVVVTLICTTMRSRKDNPSNFRPEDALTTHQWLLSALLHFTSAFISSTHTCISSSILHARLCEARILVLENPGKPCRPPQSA